MSRPAIQVENLCKEYGSVLAVDHVSFEVQAGELVGFLGENGAGKSTTMRILTTYLPATSGIARLAGFDVMTESMQVRSQLGYLPESVPLYTDMRVEEYLDFRAKLKLVPRTSRNARIDYCVERCRVKAVRKRVIGTLSKGYRQRVGLAEALLADPKVLILDEPLSGLDPIQQEDTLATIRSLAGDHTVLFSSHHLSDVEKICDRVVIIHKGKIKFDDRLSSLDAKAPRFLFEIRGNQESTGKLLEAFPGVTGLKKLTEQEPTTTWEVDTLDGQDLREPITKKLVEQGFGVRRVEVLRHTLQETFTDLILRRD
ncbi:MAG: ABC transporter ATP-binding protein [Fimbriiglobus sp.]